MRPESIAYALLFFLGIVMYNPIVLFSSGKYKAGLKCAGAICLWVIMMVSTARLLSLINPEIMDPLTTIASPSSQYEAANSRTHELPTTGRVPNDPCKQRRITF